MQSDIMIANIDFILSAHCSSEFDVKARRPDRKNNAHHTSRDVALIAL